MDAETPCGSHVNGYESLRPPKGRGLTSVGYMYLIILLEKAHTINEIS
jgi:hypothetical protein